MNTIFEQQPSNILLKLMQDQGVVDVHQDIEGQNLSQKALDRREQKVNGVKSMSYRINLKNGIQGK